MSRHTRLCQLVLGTALLLLIVTVAGCLGAGRPADRSALIEQQVLSRFSGVAEHAQVKLTRGTFETDFPFPQKGAVWGYRASWRLRGTDVEIDAWFDGRSSEATDSGHPAFPESSGLRPSEFLAVANAASKGSGDHTLAGVWKASEFGVGRGLAPRFAGVKLEELFVAGDFDGTFGPDRDNPAGSSAGYVVRLDPETGEVSYVGTYNEVMR